MESWRRYSQTNDQDQAQPDKVAPGEFTNESLMVPVPGAGGFTGDHDAIK
jgi:hypothetical protein